MVMMPVKTVTIRTNLSDGILLMHHILPVGRLAVKPKPCNNASTGTCLIHACLNTVQPRRLVAAWLVEEDGVKRYQK